MYPSEENAATLVSMKPGTTPQHRLAEIARLTDRLVYAEERLAKARAERDDAIIDAARDCESLRYHEIGIAAGFPAQRAYVTVQRIVAKAGVRRKGGARPKKGSTDG